MSDSNQEERDELPSDSNQEPQKKRAAELRKAIADHAAPLEGAANHPEMLPGESPLQYTERRRREIEWQKKHPPRPHKGDPQAGDGASGSAG